LNGTARSVALGARCAGAVIALGYLLGLVPGPLVPVIGGLALMTFGHGLLQDRASRTFSAAGLAIVAGAVGIGALRWGAMGLDAIRGAQQVLGPTVLVGPTTAATASWIAAGSALVGLGVWMSSADPGGARARVGWGAEIAIGALAVVLVFWGDAHAPGGDGSLSSLTRWGAAVAVASIAAMGGALVAVRLGPRWRWAMVAVAGIGVVVSATLLASVL
jgi:hypothetical protein